jgi:hypothetical protein
MTMATAGFMAAAFLSPPSLGTNKPVVWEERYSRMDTTVKVSAADDGGEPAHAEPDTNQPVVFADRYSRMDTTVDVSAADDGGESADADRWIASVLPTLPDANAAWLDYSIRFDGDESRHWRALNEFRNYWKPRNALWLERSIASDAGRTDGIVTATPWTPGQIIGDESKVRRQNTRHALATFRKKSQQRFDKQVKLVDNIAFKSDKGADALARAVRLDGKSISVVDGRYKINPVSSAPVFYGFSAVAQSSARTRKRTCSAGDGGRWIVQDANGVHLVSQDPGEEVN